VGQDAETEYHPCGTCAMGTGPEAVVDPKTLRVHGVDGLRVVDASIFPIIPNANLYAPVMMAAEKAADIITGTTPLPAEYVDFYRHQQTLPEKPTSGPAAAKTRKAVTGAAR